MTKKIRNIAVCSVQTPFFRGGAEVLVECLAEELNNRGFNSNIINIPFKWYPTSGIITEALAWRLLDLTESNGVKIDRVICTKFPSYVVKHPDKVVWLVHQHRAAYELFGTEYSEFSQSPEDVNVRQQIIDMDIKTINEAKKVFAISENVSNRLQKFNRINSTVLYPPPKNIELYRNEEYSEYILYVGRLDLKKRVDLLINSLPFTDPSVKAVITGVGPDQDRLKKMVRELKLEQRVDFKGYVPDQELIEIYANAFAVFYAPIDEDYGFATVEAFKSCKPVITTGDSGGVLEFVTNEKTGYICEVESNSIATAINELFRNRNKCASMGKLAGEKVKNLDWDHVIESLTRPY